MQNDGREKALLLQARHGDDEEAKNVSSRAASSYKLSAIAQRIGYGLYCHRIFLRFCKLLLLIHIAAALYYYLLGDFGADLEEDAGCYLPKLNPWDKSIEQYVSYHPTRIECERKQPELTVLERDTQRIWFNDGELSAAGLTKRKLRCMYRSFEISDDDDSALRYNYWSKLVNGTFITKEMVEIRCWRSGNKTVIYENAHSQIIPIEGEATLEKAIEVVNLAETNTTTTRTTTTIEEDSREELLTQQEHESDGVEKKKVGDDFLNRPNIILFIIDSMSRSSWLRELPRTLSVLSETYGSYIFEGMNKVASNSYPNAMAFLTGHDREELWREYGQNIYDKWPFIFFDYQKQGYATLMAEDMHPHPLFKYYNETEFIQKPFDHHYRPYGMRLLNGSRLAKNSTWYCYGNNVIHNDQLGYVQDLFRKYSRNNAKATNLTLETRGRRPIFAINWLSELSHGVLNLVSALDEDCARFFAESAPLIANNSFVFAFGDHGARFQAIRETYVGRIEEQMPFFSMHVPQPLLDRFPWLAKTLKTNTKRLSTWWDLHVTLREILDLSLRNGWHELGEDAKQPLERYRVDYGAKYGLSLLRPLPSNRGCESAHIPREYCVCERETETDAQSEEVNAAAVELLRHTNELLRRGKNNEVKLCAELTLKKVMRAHFFKRRNKAQLNYRVAVMVAPSDALLEGTLRRDYDTSKRRFRVIGDVSRLNSFNGQSYCTKSKILQSYCYCLTPLL